MDKEFINKIGTDYKESEIVEKSMKIGKSEKLELESSVWAVSGTYWTGTGKTADTLQTGIYSCNTNMQGTPYLVKQEISVDKLVELPDDPTTEVLEHITDFWNREDKFNELGFIFKRGILLHGPQGCHSENTNILMYDGSWKKVQDIVEGDLLMGPDSASRKVLSLHRGKDKMVKVKPKLGKSFIVNEGHILSLQWSGKRENKGILNISVKDYNNLSNWQKSRWMLYKSNEIEFTEKELIIPPYILGLWLGDGSSKSAQLTTMDDEIREEWVKYGSFFPTLSLKTYKKAESKASSYRFTAGNVSGLGIHKNEIINKFKQLNVFDNKHIPNIYLTGSVKQRKELLAGLIDTDGYVTECNIEFTLVNKQLTEDIAKLAQSLGYGTNLRPKIINEKTYYRLTIRADEKCSDIPTKLKHKKLINRIKDWKSNTRTSFDLEYLKKDYYYGFEVDKDNLYIMEDYFVSHNSGKSTTIFRLMKQIISQDGIALIINHPSDAIGCIKLIREIEPNRKLVALMEDVDDIIRYCGDRSLTNLLDGSDNVNRIVFVATTNYPERLPPRLLQRPSRFDIVKYIGMPSLAARLKYVKSVLNGITSPSIIDSIAKNTDEMSIAQIKEVILLVVVFEIELLEAVNRVKQLGVLGVQDVTRNVYRSLETEKRFANKDINEEQNK